VQHLEAGTALIAARGGHIDMARILAGELRADLTILQRLAYTEVYRHSGELSDRTLALATAGQFSIEWDSSTIGELLQSIATTDKQQGYVMPSLEADDEVVPLVCWEVGALFQRQSDREQQLIHNPRATENTELMERFGINPTTELGHLALGRGKAHDRVVVELMRVTKDDAPKTTRAMMDIIQDPTEKVRAMAILSNGRAA
jgi:hypothetical protein